MKPTQRLIPDGGSACGSVNFVQRIGDTVCRPTRVWSPSVHELLRFLEERGFEYSPRFIEFDEEKQVERLSYLDGEVALRPWPEVMRSLSGLRQVAEMLGRYHRLVKDFQSTRNCWHLADRSLPAETIIRHGDIGPWNMVWKGEELVGLIDWDFAEPGTVLEDIAQAAWHCIPLKPSRRVISAGIAPEEQRSRFAYFCAACGVSEASVLETLPTIHQQELERMRTHGAEGLQPWSDFLARGNDEVVSEDADWLAQEFSL